MILCGEIEITQVILRILFHLATNATILMTQEKL
jgi:hypothetical protein